MKPTRNRIFCHECQKHKMLFQSQKSADNFILFNHDGIYESTGFAPIRSYFCPACNGWHVTHIHQYEEKPISEMERAIAAFHALKRSCIVGAESRCQSLLHRIAQSLRSGSPEAYVCLMLEIKENIESFSYGKQRLKQQMRIIDQYSHYREALHLKEKEFDLVLSPYLKVIHQLFETDTLLDQLRTAIGTKHYDKCRALIDSIAVLMADPEPVNTEFTPIVQRQKDLLEKYKLQIALLCTPDALHTLIEQLNGKVFSIKHVSLAINQCNVHIQNKEYEKAERLLLHCKSIIQPLPVSKRTRCITQQINHTETFLSARKGTRFLLEMPHPDTDIALQHIEDILEEVELHMIYGDYSCCIRPLQEAYTIYTRIESDPHKCIKDIKNRMTNYVSQISDALAKEVARP